MSASSDTRFLLPPVTRTTGVWPRWPQVRPFGGLKPWPDSSSKQSQAPRSAAVLLLRARSLPSIWRSPPRPAPPPGGPGPADSGRSGSAADRAWPGCSLPRTAAGRSPRSGSASSTGTHPSPPDGWAGVQRGCGEVVTEQRSAQAGDEEAEVVAFEFAQHRAHTGQQYAGAVDLLGRRGRVRPRSHRRRPGRRPRARDAARAAGRGRILRGRRCRAGCCRRGRCCAVVRRRSPAICVRPWRQSRASASASPVPAAVAT